jgi:hypothetical protein
MKVVSVSPSGVVLLGRCSSFPRVKHPGDLAKVATLRPIVSIVKIPFNLDSYVSEVATFRCGVVRPGGRLVLVVEADGPSPECLPDWEPLPEPLLLPDSVRVSTSPPWWLARLWIEKLRRMVAQEFR